MKRRNFSSNTLQLSALSMALVLTACGGGGSDDDGSGASPNLATAQGVLVVPQSKNVSTQAAMVKSARLAKRSDAGESFSDPLGETLAAETASVGCPSVPDGYEPLSAITIQVLDQSGTNVGQFSTDECGAFRGPIPDSAYTLSAVLSDGKTVDRPAQKFVGAEPYVVSTLPVDAELVISILQNLGAGKLAITVTDSVTGKAVLGLAEENFSFTLDAAPLAAQDINYGAFTAESASVSVVLDASGSMGTSVFDPTTGMSLAAFQVASYATHELLNGLSSGKDEAGFVIFDDQIKLINNEAMESLFSWGDATGAARAEAYKFSDSGLSTDINALRPVADLYNRLSGIYLNGRSVDPVHTATGDLRIISGYYPWGGGTAFYDAMLAGLDLVNQGVNGRKMMVALTDGQDNQSSATMQTVIDSAASYGVPIFTVAFGDEYSVDEPSMQNIAALTGGEYQRVEGSDLTGLFEGIQTGIRFQYVVNFEPTAATLGQLEATVRYGVAMVSRSIPFE